jgi:hypothetical protein
MIILSDLPVKVGWHIKFKYRGLTKSHAPISYIYAMMLKKLKLNENFIL